MVKRILALLLVLTFWNIGVADPDVIRQNIKIYRTTSVPKIDGSIDDSCWQTAACARNFMIKMKSGKKAVEQTEVYMCYDSENLYIFWKVFESNMRGLKSGPPPDVNDKIETDEAVFIYLNPNNALKGYFCFAASPMGAKRDEKTDFSAGGMPGSGFDTIWQAKGGRFDGGWTMEMAIPFAAFQRNDRFAGTPEAGDVWNFNLCRNRAQGEISQFSLTSRSERNYGCFGALVFDGNMDGKPEPQIVTGNNHVAFGKNIFKFTARETKKAGIFKFQTYNNGKQATDVCTSGAVADFPIKITNGGQWLFSVKYLEDGRVCYSGSMEIEMPEIINSIKSIHNKIQFLQDKEWRIELNSDPDTAAKVINLEQLLTEISFVLNKAPDSFTDQQWQDAYSGFTKIKAAWAKIEFKVFLLSLKAENNKKQSWFAVKTASLDAKIYPEKTPDVQTSSSIDMFLAQNETRSAQLLVVPFENAMDQASVFFTDLTSGINRISASNLRWYLEEYVKTEISGQENILYEPDLLRPGREFSAPAGKIKVLLVDVYAPSGTAPGEYSGYVKVTSGTKTVEIPLKVKVLDFAIPEEMSVRHNHWLTSGIFKGGKVTPAVYEQAMQLLSQYRSQTFYFDMNTLHPLIKIYYEENGSLSFDFSGLDEYFRIGKKYHANAYWSSMSCNIAALMPFVNPGTEIIDRKTGAKLTSKDIPEMKKWLDAYREGKPAFDKDVMLAIIQATEEQNNKIYFDTNILYKAFLKDYVAYLKRQGVNEHSYYEIYDECPQVDSYWADMIRHHRFLRKHAPELKLFCFELNPCIKGQGAVGLVNGWGPQLFQCDDQDMLRSIYDRRQKYGEEFWFYVCTERVAGFSQYTPYVLRYRPNVGVRMIPWFAWYFQVDGFHVNDFQYQELVRYEGGKLLPTLRLALLRDGMQDYEYFALLSKLVKQIDAEKYSDFVIRAKQALTIEKEIISSIYDWTKSAEALDRKRFILASLIKEANNILKQ